MDIHLDIPLRFFLDQKFAIPLAHRKDFFIVLLLGTLAGFMIGTVERYLVDLSLGLPHLRTSWLRSKSASVLDKIVRLD